MLDDLDRKLLALLQRDATLTVADLGERVGLSTTPCWKRVKRLEDDGYIERKVAVLNRAKAGVPVTVFVSIRTNQHDDRWLADFATAVARMPEIVELYRMSGEVDYLMKVVTTDIDGYDRFYKRLIKAVKLTDVSSTFAMEQIKYSTEIPLAAGI
ncbi:MAG TPA: Lrp/AsnC family transcriptional regulator [Rhizomicrobium sp.]|jgi:Lrp/AsnC family transcriptional regulator|nr:Lrp/AsnC family transcriptional regulator [Rhizomicrobium sp.]HEX4534612.1 Lrp/AsnC family transcriptional regulator [Rhizomicrobium sp.]